MRSNRPREVAIPVLHTCPTWSSHTAESEAALAGYYVGPTVLLVANVCDCAASYRRAAIGVAAGDGDDSADHSRAVLASKV